MNTATIDLRLIDWTGRDGLRYRAVDRAGVLIFKPRIGSLRDLVVWASGKSNYFISKLLNQVWNAAAFSFPSPLFFAGWTATLDKTSTGSTAGEAAYTGYARVSVTANTTNFPTSSGGGNIQNATAITWPANGGTLSTWTFMQVNDASTAGNMLYFGSITSTAINPGDTPQLNVNGLTASEA